VHKVGAQGKHSLIGTTTAALSI